MSPTSERERLTRAWLRKAISDLQAANLLLKQSELHEVVAFHCQQAIEKALKGYLTWYQQPFRRTHDLVELIDQCREIDQSFESLRPFARDISPYAIVARYPDVENVVEPGEAEEAMRQTEHVISFVRARLPFGMS